MSSPHSEKTTAGIRVRAAAEFMPQDILPHEFREPSADQHVSFVFRYQITMSNVGSECVRLLSRHWVIVDGDGGREEVRGRGVVGEYPQLEPDESYSYVSYCPLKTAWGTMEGSYTFERADGSRFDVAIGRFFLVPTAPPLELEPASH